MYAGEICKRCHTGCNRDRKIIYLKEVYSKQEKRYSGYVCSTCITELAGGEKEVKKIQSRNILLEMGL